MLDAYILRDSLFDELYVHCRLAPGLWQYLRRYCDRYFCRSRTATSGRRRSRGRDMQTRQTSPSRLTPADQARFRNDAYDCRHHRRNESVFQRLQRDTEGLVYTDTNDVNEWRRAEWKPGLPPSPDARRSCCWSWSFCCCPLKRTISASKLLLN